MHERVKECGRLSKDGKIPNKLIHRFPHDFSSFYRNDLHYDGIEATLILSCDVLIFRRYITSKLHPIPLKDPEIMK